MTARKARTNFNPRSPCGERRPRPVHKFRVQVFQSTLPLRGATSSTNGSTIRSSISIHAPLAGSDGSDFDYSRILQIFQSTLPLRGATPEILLRFQVIQFQSTLPLRGATCRRPAAMHRPLHFNPRSPCGERPILSVSRAICDAISIHAPLAGSDVKAYPLSSPSVISIHAPLAGSDSETNKYYLLFRDKNSMFPAICTAKSIKPSLKPRFRTRYVHFFRCESFGHFMISSFSHRKIKTRKSEPLPLGFPAFSQSALLYLYESSRDYKSEDCPFSHQ